MFDPIILFGFAGLTVVLLLGAALYAYLIKLEKRN